jgi:hypothetical protein
MSSAMSSNLANAGSGGYPRHAERAKTIDGGNEEQRAFADGLVNGSDRF